MAADHSARGSMKTGVKPETVCELQDTNDHRQVERKWRLPISVGELSTLEGRLKNLFQHSVLPTAMDARHSVPHAALSRGDVPGTVCYGVVSSALRTRQRSRSASNALILIIMGNAERQAEPSYIFIFRPRGCWITH